MKNLIVFLMFISSAFPQEPIKFPQEPIKFSIPNEDWAKVSLAITRLMKQPPMQVSEVVDGRRYRQSFWIQETIAVSARMKVAPEPEPIEVEVSIADTAESSEKAKP